MHILTFKGRLYNNFVQIDRESVTLEQSFYPFREGNDKLQISLVPNGPQFPIDFKVQPVDHPSLPNAGYFECIGAQLLHPLALTTRNGIYLDPSSRLDLSVQIPGMPKLTGKIRPGLYEERKLEWWYYDPSLWMPRLKTPHFLPPPLPILATPGFLGPDPSYKAGEAYGGKLIIKNDPEALSAIKVEFSLTDPDTLPRLLAAKRKIWEDVWNNFAWERLLPEKGLIQVLDSGILDQKTADIIMQLIGTEGSRSADELIAQADMMQTSAYRWALRRKAESYRLFREQEDRFRM